MFHTPNCTISVGASAGVYAVNVIPPPGFACARLRARVVGATADEERILADHFVIELRRGGALVARVDGLLAIEGAGLPASSPFSGDEEMEIVVTRSADGEAFDLRLISVP